MGTRRGAVLIITIIIAAAGAAFYLHRPAPRDLILATTTSLQDSGLLDVLVPLFEAKTGRRLKTVAVGSGQALALGKRGEADVLLVHSPEAEEAFMSQGHGSERLPVMTNDFLVVGPPSDPAGVGGSPSAAAAFQRIARARALFVSRGDASGTHARERTLWAAAGINPEGERWYQQTGLGMGQTLGVASEKGGYTLTDRGTFLTLGKNLGLKILGEGDHLLVNTYSVIIVNPEKSRNIDTQGARAFAAFLTEAETQGIIGRFGVERYGAPLFSPCGAYGTPQR
ncbi:MAG TPA: substrate-binding domain-containing protein [Syntrophales bacterium]|nr:substrate-binding domain-containing protein [Syntrophales bacterium]HOM08175.1 substrate-binding domain-containing protein [Syntrophales bacterium]HON99211.1 substrate-binding domain-containing protein [Syntrophales bacterium]HPC00319.1 substrate-binding domain-containing protein [Syntrophales bacterium]HPQ05981.1 substrate-binding domain-containing protein [Syntrophales bacterium]